LRVASLFHAKARLFVKGRRHVFSILEKKLKEDHRRKIWIHCASLGEFEQGRPLIEAIKSHFPQYSIVLTFFSPSGFEVRKNYELADHICYLPLDTHRNAQHFLDLVQPECALFVKYEFWYHYLEALHKRNIPTILFSAVFQPRHPFFKWYGGLYRPMLGFYRQVFVQDQTSLDLLKRLGVDHAQVAGDTRFDRAAKVLEQDRSFPEIAAFKTGHKLLMAGSTWPEDEQLLQKTLEQLPPDFKLLIAPHETDDVHIAALQKLFPGSCLWNAGEHELRKSRVCLVHTVGQLAYLYKYADMVWMGGGFTRSGIHNIIEPAVFGVPIFFGPKYQRYLEATDMTGLGAAKSLEDAEALAAALQNEKALLLMGNNAQQYVHSQLGATAKIMDYLSNIL